MAARSSGTSRLLRVWLPAVVLIPALLAGVALLWPGAQISDDVRRRAVTALAGAGMDGVSVAVSGRDVELAAVPAGSEQVALGAVATVDGIRAVGIRPDSAAAPVTNPPVPNPPGGPPADGGPVAAQVAALVAAAPVTFPADSSQLTGAAAATVARAAGLLAAAPGVTIDLVGFAADTPGPPEAAQRLSEERAAAVASALAAGGVDPARISTRGLGNSRPLSTTAASRRVEISVKQG